MSDVVVRVELENQADEEALSAAILAYAQWRSDAVEDDLEDDEDGDAPEIMVRTSCEPTGICKTLIFQDRAWAAQFLSYWRKARRLSS
ncbi:MAG: hypothetical protein AAFQ67_03540 [Pseudomonadota bacterium]